MTATWQKCIRLKEPLLTKPFYVFAGLSVLALLLSIYRELTGLGYVTGLNDGYSWGLFKNWNVTALTALGSGGYAVAVMAWIFNERKFHPILRTAVLTSLLGYGTGMLALGFDVGRPWNFIHMNNPRNWNMHSVLLEVAVCMTAYAILALDMENMPPFLERIYRGSDPVKSARALEVLPFHAEDISVWDRAGIHSSFDAPILARLTDVSRREPGQRIVADSDASSSVFGDGLHPGLCVRVIGADVE